MKVIDVLDSVEMVIFFKIIFFALFICMLLVNMLYLWTVFAEDVAIQSLIFGLGFAIGIYGIFFTLMATSELVFSYYRKNTIEVSV